MLLMLGLKWRNKWSPWVLNLSISILRSSSKMVLKLADMRQFRHQNFERLNLRNLES